MEPTVIMSNPASCWSSSSEKPMPQGGFRNPHRLARFIPAIRWRDRHVSRDRGCGGRDRAFAASLTEEILVEMKEPCDVISGDPSTCGNDVTALCNSFLKWSRQNR